MLSKAESPNDTKTQKISATNTLFETRKRLTEN